MSCNYLLKFTLQTLKYIYSFAKYLIGMIKKLLILIFIFQGITLDAQTLRILDKSNLDPIDNVAIFNLDHSKTALTTIDGITDLAEFNKNDTLIFQHPSYQNLILPYGSLSIVNYVIKLAPSTINLDPFVVSANKWEQKRDEVPNKITTIKSKDIAFLNPQTTADFLNTSNEVFIQKSQMGGGSPMIRGFSANSVLLVIDGVRMNNAIYRSGNLQNVITLDPNNIENAEIIFGPGSIIYGSDALGGVMDFHSKKVKLSKDSTIIYNVNALGRYSSANNEKTGHIDLSFGNKHLGSLTSISFSDFEDLKMGSNSNDDYQRNHYVETNGVTDHMRENDDPNIQKFSGYNQLNLLQKFRYKVNDKLNFNYAFHYSTSSNVPRYDRLIEYASIDTLKYAEWYYGPQKWMMHNLSMDLADSTKLFDDLKLTLAYQKVEESRVDRKFNSSSLRKRTENVDVYTLNLDLDKIFSQKTTLFYGVEGFYNYVNSEGIKINVEEKDTTKTSSRYPDGGSNYSTVAAYANLKSNLSEKITLQTGLRYSYVWLLSKFDNKAFFPFDYDEIQLKTGALNGSIGIVYRANKKLHFTSNLSSGFRAPNIDDIAKVFDSEPGNVVVPNSDLKPEYSYNIDMGSTFSFSEKTKLNITVFYTYLIDAMVRQDFTLNGMDSIYYDGELSKVQAIVNGSTANIYGGSFSFMADISNKFGFTTNLTYMKGEDEDHSPIRHVSPLFGSTSLTYTASKLKLDFYINYNGQISAENMALTEREKPHIYSINSNNEPYSPSWYTLNLKGYYQINEKLQLNIGIENILNKRYRPYSSGIVAPGINFIAAIRASL